MSTLTEVLADHEPVLIHGNYDGPRRFTCSKISCMARYQRGWPKPEYFQHVEDMLVANGVVVR